MAQQIDFFHDIMLGFYVLVHQRKWIFIGEPRNCVRSHLHDFERSFNFGSVNGCGKFILIVLMANICI